MAVLQEYSIRTANGLAEIGAGKARNTVKAKEKRRRACYILHITFALIIRLPLQARSVKRQYRIVGLSMLRSRHYRP